MNTTTAYTPLETLLLFQSLAAYGTTDADFERISELLTNNVLIKEGDTYDAQRLTAPSLRDLYVQLLCDELNDGARDGTATLSKKRKLQSPPLPSPSDTKEYAEKLPLLVDRLYARYRDYMIRAIRDDEEKFSEIQNDITEIEKGSWDERILKDDKALANGIASPENKAKANGALAADLSQASHSKETSELSETSVQQHSSTGAKAEGLAISDVLNNQEQSAPSGTVEQPKNASHGGSQPQNGAGSNISHAPSPLQPPLHPVHVPPPQNYGWAPPYQPGIPQHYNPQYPLQYPQHHRPSLPSPHHLPSPFPVPSSPLGSQPFSQGVLPHPQPTRPSSSPGLPLNTLADAAGQHSQQSKTNPGSPMMTHSTPNAVPPHYAQRSPSASGPYPPAWQSTQVQHGASPSYPPNYQPPYIPPHLQPPHHLPGSPPLRQPGTPTYNSPYNPGQARRPPPPGVLRSQPSTPKPSRASFSTGLGTRWTPTPTSRTPGPYVHVDRPEMEPLSPILGPTETHESSKVPLKHSVESFGSIKRPSRGKKRPRAESTTSSARAGSRRSQSVVSHVDELALDVPPSRAVKQEVATPIGVEESEELGTGHGLSETPLQRHSTKRKREIISIDSRSPSMPPTRVLWTRAFPKISASALEAIAGHKNASTFSAPVKERDAPGYKTLILRPQDLKSIRSAIIAGNRAATLAAPEDLNPSASSCWLPIAEDLIPPKGIINYAQLEKELMRMFANAVMFNADPDRGLGRDWEQVRKDKGEVLGYEIDEDGVVKETKAMFADVEKIIGSLRSAERKSEELEEGSTVARIDEDDIDELAGDAESVAGTASNVSKRRRKG